MKRTLGPRFTTMLNSNLTPHHLLNETAEVFELPLRKLKHCQEWVYAQARYCLWYILREETSLRLREMSDMFGFDLTTIQQGAKRCPVLCEIDAVYAVRYSVLLARLKTLINNQPSPDSHGR